MGYILLPKMYHYLSKIQISLDILYFYVVSLTILAIYFLWIQLSIIEREKTNEKESHSSSKREY